MGLSHAAAGLARGLRVAVFERNAAVTEASVRNFGLLTSLYDGGGVWGDRSQRSRALYRGWSARGGCPLSTPGSLQLAQTPLQWELLKSFAAAAPSLRYPVELVGAREACELVPSLNPAGLYGALRFPQDSLLEPRVMFHREHGLPGTLARTGVDFFFSTPVTALRGSSPAAITLGTASGDSFEARRVVLCSGSDVSSLAPSVFAAEAHKLRQCKLQMLRLHLAPPRQGCTNPHIVTSGLSLRRYPGPRAVCPAEHAAMMTGEGGPGSATAAAEALGIHIIARPAAAFPRTPFGGLAREAAAGAAALGVPAQQLSGEEWVVGDSHEYSPLGESGFDEACSEGLTDQILGVAAGMFQGIGGLLESRGANAGSTGSAPTLHYRARLLQQWSGVYLDHREGFFSADCVLQGAAVARVTPEEAAGLPGATLHIATGVGGQGMTMSPALGEEFVARFFP